MTANADILWKMIVQGLFEDLVLFALPELHAAVNWDKEVKFLDQEMPKIKEPRKRGIRYVDVLASFYLKEGEESLILLHLEIQDDPIDTPIKLSKRMFQYYIRIRDKLEIDITSMAFLIGEANDSGIHHEENFGTKITYEYNVLHIKGLDAQKLEQSSNPFALAALAGQKVIEAKGNDLQKLNFARELFRLLKAHGYSPQKTTALFLFLEGIFEPKSKELLKEYTKEVDQMICNQELPMVMTPTIRRWCKEAEMEGELKGKLEGKLETARNMLSRGMGILLISDLTGLSIEEITALEEKE